MPGIKLYVGRASVDYLSDEKPRLMTVGDLSKYLRICRGTVYRLVKAEKIPVSRVGKHLRFRKDVVDAWLANMEKETGQSDKNTK